MNTAEEQKWLDWAIELQAIAQAGLFFSKDVFDRERYQRVRDIAAEIIAHKSDVSIDKVKNLFCCETGYQTPKIGTRAAVFKEDKILLVREKTGEWALPGGWCDVDCSIKENMVKEVREEAGLDVTADWVIAVLDRDKHNTPKYAFKICTFFVMCTILGGSFCENSETTESGFFALDELPPISESKNNLEQIRMCFEAHFAEHWDTIVD